jgi:hypothetical protein
MARRAVTVLAGSPGGHLDLLVAVGPALDGPRAWVTAPGPQADELERLGERVERLPDRVLLYADDGEAAAAAAHARGLQPESVLVRRSSLEDVFLRLTGRSLVD